MQIFVKLFDGTTIDLVTEPSEAIETVRAKLQEKTGFPATDADKVRILRGGKQLENGRTLNDYNVRDHATLLLVGRLR